MKTVVFLPGWGIDKSIYEEIAKEVHDFADTLLLDIPVDMVMDTAPEDCAKKLAELLQPQLPRNSVVAAWSMAALPAIYLAHTGQVHSLCLLAATPCFCIRPGWSRAVSSEKILGMMQMLGKDKDSCLNQFCALAAHNSPRQYLRKLRQHTSSSPVPVLKHGLEILRCCDARQTLAELDCQVEFILGEDDPLVPGTAASDISKLQPEARINIIPGCGHMPFLSHRQDTLSILERLSG